MTKLNYVTTKLNLLTLNYKYNIIHRIGEVSCSDIQVYYHITSHLREAHIYIHGDKDYTTL